MTIPETMKAYLLTGFGGFENLSYREDIAVPSPGPNECTSCNLRTQRACQGTTSFFGKTFLG
jgi:hypothetical protein